MRCKICGCEYTHRCYNSKYHIYIQEHYELIDNVNKIARIIGDAVDQARKTKGSVRGGTRIKSTTRSGSPRNNSGTSRVAGTLRLR